VINYTQGQLDELVSCRKEIIEPPKKNLVTLRGSRRNDFKAQCEQGRRFSIFMRINEAFEEDFSIGLMYEPLGDDAVTLLRCNGPHGDVLVSVANPHPHFGYHIHRALEENIAAGRRPEAGAAITTEYSSYQQALRYFLGRANIEWNSKDFPDISQPSLFQ